MLHARCFGFLQALRGRFRTAMNKLGAERVLAAEKSPGPRVARLITSLFNEFCWVLVLCPPGVFSQPEFLDCIFFWSGQEDWLRQEAWLPFSSKTTSAEDTSYHVPMDPVAHWNALCWTLEPLASGIARSLCGKRTGRPQRPCRQSPTEA